MNNTFPRHSFDARRIEHLRLVVCAVGLLALSSVWHASRRGLIFWAGKSSIGSGRTKLIAAALRTRYPDVPSNDELWTHTLPRPGWVAWQTVLSRSQRPDGSWTAKLQYHFADDGFRARGSISAAFMVERPATDADGDGRWEVRYETLAVPLESLKQRDVRRWAVIQLGTSSNQIVWVGLVDASAWARRRARLKPIWRDEDGDGMSELVLVTLGVINVTPQRTLTCPPPQTIAVFAWDRPGGVLREQMPAADQSVISWKPPESALEVPVDADLEPILADLLPVPDGFGLSPSTQPASAPAVGASQP